MQNQTNPLIVQSDRTLLLDVHAPRADDCRSALIPFAELERSPEHLHTYRLTALSLWNAASAGFTAQDAIDALNEYSRFPVPQSVTFWIEETAGRFGKLRLCLPETGTGRAVKEPNTEHAESSVAESSEGESTVNKSFIIEESSHKAEAAAGTDIRTDSTDSTDSDTDTPDVSEEVLYLETASALVYKEIEAAKQMQKLLTPVPAKGVWRFELKLVDRGTVKQKLLTLGWPVKDEVPLTDGEPLDITLRETCNTGKPFTVRAYQQKAADALVGNKGPGTGFGTIVLPCGAGKTIVGMEIMARLKTSTLIVTTNISAVHQWIGELIDKTNLDPSQIGEYTGEEKEIKPVTVATYQVLTWRPTQDGPYPHFSVFRTRAWGLIIYDEVHMLPAPVFRVTAELQTIRRVGLTATLVREDGCEGHVFSLVGPKRYDVPWKELESSGWIAEAECIEVRVDLPESREIEYAVANMRTKHRIASDNESKLQLVRQITELFPDDKILVIGQYLERLNEIAQTLNVPIITGKTPNAERDRIYGAFRRGELRVIVVSKVANFAIDLPDASLAIQISGTFGSRQEEAQRLGRILRPKDRKARFFTLITRNTVEEEYGSHRQKFLAEQGYDYRIVKYVDAESFAEQVAGGCE